MILLARDTAALVTLTLLAWRYVKASGSELGLAKPDIRQILVGIAVAVGYALVILPALAHVIPKQPINPWLEALNGSPLIAQVFLLVEAGLYSPFVQELVFRGFLLAGLMQRMNVHVAVLLSSSIFALIHLQSGVLATVGALSIGMLQGYLFARFRSLTAPIASHVVINSWSFSAMILALRAAQH